MRLVCPAPVAHKSILPYDVHDGQEPFSPMGRAGRARSNEIAMTLAWPQSPYEQRSLWVVPVAWLIPILAAIIGGIGVATLYSVAGGSMEPWAMRHVIRLIVGFGIMFALLPVPARHWLDWALPIYLAALLLVLAVMLRGSEALGAQRWLVMGPLSLQPSEIMTFAMVLMLARYYHGLPGRLVSHPVAVSIPVLLVAMPMLLILKQPDLGTAILLGTTGLVLIVLSGTSLKYIAAGGALMVLAAPLSWTLLHGYQKQRLLVFWDPAIDPLGKGYQIYQSKIALGSGGYAGKGFLQGTQTQLDFVPEKHTDFVFALWAEETGFVGSMILAGLFLLLVWCLMVLALRARTVFARLAIAGIATSLFLHVFVNIAMVVGLVPVVGVPLPLISYGGTSLFSLLIGIGLCLGLARQGEDRRRATSLLRRPA